MLYQIHMHPYSVSFFLILLPSPLKKDSFLVERNLLVLCTTCVQSLVSGWLIVSICTMGWFTGREGSEAGNVSEHSLWLSHGCLYLCRFCHPSRHQTHATLSCSVFRCHDSDCKQYKTPGYSLLCLFMGKTVICNGRIVKQRGTEREGWGIFRIECWSVIRSV